MVVNKVINGPLAADFLVIQNVRKDLQQVRFTTSKETGNPHAHLGGIPVDTFCIGREEISKVALQLRRDHIFFKLGGDIGFLALTGNHNTLDITGDWFLKHLLNSHGLYLTSQA